MKVDLSCEAFIDYMRECGDNRPSDVIEEAYTRLFVPVLKEFLERKQAEDPSSGPLNAIYASLATDAYMNHVSKRN